MVHTIIMSYPKEFRKKVFELKEKENLTIKETANRFGISVRSIYKWKYKPSPQKTRNKPATKIDMVALKKDVEDNPDLYLQERAETFKVSGSAIFYALRRLNIRVKKKSKSSKSRSRQKGYFQEGAGKI